MRPERGLRPWVLQQTVLPHDGTPTAAAAMGLAVDLAQRSGGELDVLHIPTPDAPTEPGTLSAPQYLDRPQHAWPLWAREFLERTPGLCDCPPSVRTRLFLRRGRPEPRAGGSRKSATGT